jgi:hypothetical protein
MIAAAQIASSVRAFPDAAPVAPPVSPEETGVSTHANFRSVLHQYHSPYQRDSEEDDTKSSDQQKQKDSNPTRTIAAPLPVTPAVEPLRLILPLTASITLRQDGTALQNSSTVAQGATAGPDADPKVVRSHYFSPQLDSIKDDVQSSGQEKAKDSDPTRTVAASLPVTQTVEPPRSILPLTASITLRQDGTALQNSSAAAQDAILAPETEPRAVAPPVLEQLDDSTTAVGSLAFAARLSPSAGTQQPAPDANRSAELQPRLQTPLQITTQMTAKQVATGADVPADAHSSEGGDQSARERASDLFAKPNALLPQTQAEAPGQAATPAHNEAPTSQSSPMARMEKVMDPPAAPSSANHDITIRIPDSEGTAVRFMERGGEVHVSVRTGDAEMAQTLRGGLNDLVNRLEDGGIRTEVWQPGSDASSSQNDSHHPFADPDGSNGRQYSSGSNSEQESNQQNKPRWVEELEGSIGNQSFKEIKQLLWQA